MYNTRNSKILEAGKDLVPMEPEIDRVMKRNRQLSRHSSKSDSAPDSSPISLRASIEPPDFKSPGMSFGDNFDSSPVAKQTGAGSLEVSSFDLSASLNATKSEIFTRPRSVPSSPLQLLELSDKVTQLQQEKLDALQKEKTVLEVKLTDQERVLRGLRNSLTEQGERFVMAANVTDEIQKELMKVSATMQQRKPTPKKKDQEIQTISETISIPCLFVLLIVAFSLQYGLAFSVLPAAISCSHNNLSLLTQFPNTSGIPLYMQEKCPLCVQKIVSCPEPKCPLPETKELAKPATPREEYTLSKWECKKTCINHCSEFCYKQEKPLRTAEDKLNMKLQETEQAKLAVETQNLKLQELLHTAQEEAKDAKLTVRKVNATLQQATEQNAALQTQLEKETKTRLAAEAAMARLVSTAENARLATEEEKSVLKTEAEKARLAATAVKVKLDEASNAILEAETEKARLAAAAEDARLKAESVNAELKRAEDARLQAEAEKARLAEAAEDARLQAEAEKARLAAAAEDARLQAEAEKARLAEAAEDARLQAEAEKARLAEAAEDARLQAEAEKARLAAAAEDARLQAEAEKTRLAAAAEDARLQAEAEKARLATEAGKLQNKLEEANKARLTIEKVKEKLAAEAWKKEEEAEKIQSMAAYLTSLGQKIQMYVLDKVQELSGKPGQSPEDLEAEAASDTSTEEIEQMTEDLQEDAASATLTEEQESTLQSETATENQTMLQYLQDLTKTAELYLSIIAIVIVLFYIIRPSVPKKSNRLVEQPQQVAQRKPFSLPLERSARLYAE
jgi:hypothetical protein